MDLNMPEGITLEAGANRRFDIIYKGDVVGVIMEWDKRDGGTEWSSRGLGHSLVGEYDTAQEALDASLKDSGIIVDKG